MSDLSPFRPSEFVTAASQITPLPGGPFLVATFPGRRYERQITRILINGPGGSLISGYLGSMSQYSAFTTAGRGDFNENDMNQPVWVPQGWPIYMVWNSNTGPANATLMFSRVGGGGAA